MIRASITAAAILVAGMTLGCKQERSFVEAPVVLDKDLRKLERTNLNYVQAPVGDVVTQMQIQFKCRINVSNNARDFIRANDLRVTAQVENLPVELAFKVLQADLEFKGLVLIAKGNALGRASYILDRSMVRDMTVPATAAKSPTRSGADF